MASDALPGSANNWTAGLTAEHNSNWFTREAWDFQAANEVFTDRQIQSANEYKDGIYSAMVAIDELSIK